MKKNKIIILVMVILIIIGVILFIIFGKGKNNKKQKILDIYDNLASSKSYSFIIKQNNDNKTIMARKDDKTVIDQYTEESHNTTLVKDGNTYLILHDREEYYVYLRNNVEQNILTDGLKELIEKEYLIGTEKVRGKNYSYEEYSGDTIFMMSNTLNTNSEEIKTRFYFDKNNKLVYIKTITKDGEELLQIEISNEVNDSLFEIPSTYAEN